MATELQAWVLCLGTGDQVGTVIRSLCARDTWPTDLQWQHASAWPFSPLGDAPDSAALPHPGARPGTQATPLIVLLIEPAPGTWRGELDRRSWPYAILQSDGASLIEQAEGVILHAWARASQTEAEQRVPRWRWVCADCDDGDCERHWLLATRNDADACPD